MNSDWLRPIYTMHYASLRLPRSRTCSTEKGEALVLLHQNQLISKHCPFKSWRSQLWRCSQEFCSAWEFQVDVAYTRGRIKGNWRGNKAMSPVGPKSQRSRSRVVWRSIPPETGSQYPFKGNWRIRWDRWCRSFWGRGFWGRASSYWGFRQRSRFRWSNCGRGRL